MGQKPELRTPGLARRLVRTHTAANEDGCEVDEIAPPGWTAHSGRGAMSDERVAPETRGVAIELLGTVDLDGEIEGLEGLELRMRKVTIEPGGVLGPVHDHKGRPGLVWILQGTITDHRDGVVTEYGPGFGWPEDHETLHWLENRGSLSAVEISIDIVSKE